METSSQSILQPERPKNWLVESIIATILCCMPFGVAGIVFAAQVNSKYDAGDYEGAVKSSKEAGKWTKISFFVALAGWIIYIILFFVFGGIALFSSSAIMNN